jgi:hypothetical protein
MIMKNSGLKTFFAAIAVTTALASCHSYANDNTSRPCVPDENGDNIGNDEITENRSMGSDCNPNNVMWDGYTSPEERVGDVPCAEKCNNGDKHDAHGEGHDKGHAEEPKEDAGHGHH